MNFNVQTVDYARIDAFVDKQRSLGSEIYWNGWELVFFRPAADAEFRRQGVFYKDRWGFANRFAIQTDGTYQIDRRNIRNPRHSRNR